MYSTTASVVVWTRSVIVKGMQEDPQVPSLSPLHSGRSPMTSCLTDLPVVTCSRYLPQSYQCRNFLWALLPCRDLWFGASAILPAGLDGLSWSRSEQPLSAMFIIVYGRIRSLVTPALCWGPQADTHKQAH
jgi:hypothetical protein